MSFAVADLAPLPAQAWSWGQPGAGDKQFSEFKTSRDIPRLRRRVREARHSDSGVEQSKPAREPFSEEEQRQAHVPGFADVRFWADSASEYAKVLPELHGAWLVLSSGGPDAAYGAGFLNGWSGTGARPEFSAVTGIGTSALSAVFAFAGPRYDNALRNFFTGMSAGDFFELRASKESEVDNAPLKRQIAKIVTDRLLADVATGHERGRRLFLLTTNLDAGRPVVWNMGAIAVVRDERALQLFRAIVLASLSPPEKCPPIYIEVEANGRHFSEMHVDGSVSGLMYLAPETYLFGAGPRRLPMSHLHVVLNGKAAAGFSVVDRVRSEILNRSISIVRRTSTQTDLALLYQAASLAAADFSLASIDGEFDNVATNAVDPKYMNLLFELGLRQGKALQLVKNLPFRAEAPVSHASSDGTAPEN